MKNSPSAVAGGLFFCVRREGSFVLRRRVHDLSPTGIISRLRARDGAFRAPARVTFFCCQKKVTKENRLKLRFKTSLARGGQVRIWRYALAHEVRWVTLSVQGTACTSCAAAADAVRVGAGALIVFGDYQIAPIAARSTAMGRCALRARGVICLLFRNTREQKSLP